MRQKTDLVSNFFDLPLFSGSKSTLLSAIEDTIDNSSITAYIFTPNPEQVVIAHQNASFLRILKAGTWLLPDGVGLVWASRWLASKNRPALQHRLPGREIACDLIHLAKQRQMPVLIIGGKNYAGLTIGETVIKSLSTMSAPTEKHSQFEVWWTPGYADKSTPTPQEEERLKTAIADLRPKFIFVAFGAPFQEEWIDRHWQWFQQNKTAIVMAVGGSFDVLTGKLKTPPTWVSQIGFEWLFRLIQEPWRAGRQLRLVQFIWLTILRRG